MSLFVFEFFIVALLVVSFLLLHFLGTGSMLKSSKGTSFLQTKETKISKLLQERERLLQSVSRSSWRERDVYHHFAVEVRGIKRKRDEGDSLSDHEIALTQVYSEEQLSFLEFASLGIPLGGLQCQTFRKVLKDDFPFLPDDITGQEIGGACYSVLTMRLSPREAVAKERLLQEGRARISSKGHQKKKNQPQI